ncbi:hypothetical protein [Paenibacillus sp. LHD-38]|uniref:hypothetical protein n=1 Tax=Paenibacillus sp. LHD-38 TaxID=3072143 RepID=UPI00280CD70F|nr:hypothetical protein [Paenibacillus sp. LHD-38]MDQ8738048.1 hypothetical protein [Paenibacillus sp. LHD-38]
MSNKMLLFVLCWIILLSTAAAAKPEGVFACSCAYRITSESAIKEELKRKTAIFAGTVTKITKRSQTGSVSSDELVPINLDVTTVWKGDLEQQLVVYTARSSVSCGYEHFQVGKAYLVSAYESDGKLLTGVCDLTDSMPLTKAELNVLGDGYAPKPLNNSELPSSVSNTQEQNVPVQPKGEEPAIGIGTSTNTNTSPLNGAVVLIIISAVTLLLIRRRRKP